MFTLKEINKALKLYDKIKSLRKVQSTLGYPSVLTLRKWLMARKNGTLESIAFKFNGQYTERQARAAVRYYLSHGLSQVQTVAKLGYPDVQMLRRWIKLYAPQETVAAEVTASAIPEEVKIKAVTAMRTRERSVISVARELGVNRPTLYAWAREIPWIKVGAEEKMPKRLKYLKDTAPAEPAGVEPHGSQDTELTADERLDRALAKVALLEKQVASLVAESDTLQRDIYHLRLQKDVLVKTAEILKKDGGVNHKSLSNREKTRVIDALRCDYKLKDLLLEFGISKSSYCYQKAILLRPDKYEDIRITVKTIFSENYSCYGYRRIWAHLKQSGICLSEKVVRRLMREEGLRVSLLRVRKYSSYQGELSSAPENLLKRDFHADRPNEKWLTDITEFSIPAGKVYLSPIIDCHDGMPVSWTIGTSPNAILANTMLKGAIKTLKPGEQPIIHSDRGCHYRWPGWIQLVQESGLTRSMSKKGCSPDNSACEGFFGRLKNEAFYGRDWHSVTIKQFIKWVDDYICWYKEKRIKISLGGQSPLQYRQANGLA